MNPFAEVNALMAVELMKAQQDEFCEDPLNHVLMLMDSRVSAALLYIQSTYGEQAARDVLTVLKGRG